MSYCVGQNISHGHSSLCRKAEGTGNWIPTYLDVLVMCSRDINHFCFLGERALHLCMQILRGVPGFYSRSLTLCTLHTTHTTPIQLDLAVCDTVVTPLLFPPRPSLGPPGSALTSLPSLTGYFTGSSLSLQISRFDFPPPELLCITSSLRNLIIYSQTVWRFHV